MLPFFLALFALVNLILLTHVFRRTLHLWRTEGFLRPSVRLRMGRYVSRNRAEIGAAVAVILLVLTLLYYLY